jgi:putative glutamine amidotransferase
MTTPARTTGPGAGRNAPRILITSADPATEPDAAVAVERIQRYVEAIERAGGEPVTIDAGRPSAERASLLASMDGLLLSGGPDVHPSRFGQPMAGTRDVDLARDALEHEAWSAAGERGLPVLGICRGLQAINVFSGGSLAQHLEGHAGPAPGHGPALRHPLRIVPGTRLARILGPNDPRMRVLDVNSFHHQAVRAADLAPGLAVAGWSSSPEGDIVEALETPSGRFVLGLQSHPERTDSTPSAFERVWRFFVDACRGPITDR